MKTARKILGAAGLGSSITAVAVAGQPVLAFLTLLIFAAVAVLCWVVTNAERTLNTVAIITAFRSDPYGIASLPPDSPPDSRGKPRAPKRQAAR